MWAAVVAVAGQVDIGFESMSRGKMGARPGMCRMKGVVEARDQPESVGSCSLTG